ncbi:kunitz-type protease inhibitor 2 [Xyrichtys novacula]|uniref:Kunitz-type protease inhibitor 2 n=1 Tax=Xyrichtys novacula TaxID=13765 RepID=A0AAV1FXN5_XYRNO|nr:kunitz-type protease inhibitor 2 [Xyrichtys novacula]
MDPRFNSRLWAVCFLVCTSVALDCDWDKSIDPNQGLGMLSMERGAVLGQAWKVLEPEACREACCDASDCDLVVVDPSADGGPQCLMVRCVVGDRDVCALQPSAQLRVYRKARISVARNHTGTGGDGPHISPMSLEPGTRLKASNNQNNEDSNVRCRLPMKVGLCRAAFPKFYYEPTNQSCRSFIYGGCDANANMFDSKEECEDTCRGVTGPVLPDESTAATPQPQVNTAALLPSLNTSEVEADITDSSTTQRAERCGAEPQVGHCRAAFRRWYYNRQTGSCQSFIYGGCGGNKNNHLSMESCIAACTVSVQPSSQKAAAADVSVKYTDRCTVTPDPGPCRAAFPAFYYDPESSTCYPFLYGGCFGNQNRYGSHEDCMNHCSRNSQFEGQGNPRNHWTAG